MFLFLTEQIPILFDQTNEIKDWSFNSNVSTNREYQAYHRRKEQFTLYDKVNALQFDFLSTYKIIHAATRKRLSNDDTNLFHKTV